MSTVVKWLGLDLSKLLANEPVENAALSVDNLQDNECVINLHNKNNAFSQNNPSSILSNLSWIGTPITVTRDDEPIIDGVVTAGLVTNNIFKLTVQSYFKRIFDEPINYIKVKTDPAAAAVGILESKRFNDYIDYHSFGLSSAMYQDNNVSINVVYDLSYNINVKNAIDSLAQMGTAYIYRYQNKIYYKMYDKDIPDSLYHITDKNMFSSPKGKNAGQNVVYNNYEINYLLSGNVPAKDTDSSSSGYGQAGRGGNFSSNSFLRDYGVMTRLQCNNITTAHYLGWLRMLRDRYPKDRLSFDMRNDLYPLVPGNIYNITSSQYGWTNKRSILLSISKMQKKTACIFEEIR